MADVDLEVISRFYPPSPKALHAHCEGAARGLPLVSTTAGGCSDLLVDRSNALLVPPDYPEAIARAVSELKADGEVRRNLIRGGYDLARRSTYESLGMKFVKEIMEVLRGTKD